VFFTAPAPPYLYTLSLHDALPISGIMRNADIPVRQVYRILCTALTCRPAPRDRPQGLLAGLHCGAFQPFRPLAIAAGSGGHRVRRSWPALRLRYHAATGDLMPECEDLDLLGTVTAAEQDQELKDTAEDQVQDRPEGEQRGCPLREHAGAMNL